MIRLAVRCPPELADRVLAELLELAPGGVEEDRGPERVEFAIYGPPGELPALPDLEAATGEGLVEITSTEIPDDWADRWRDFHEPVWIGDRICVRPSWREAPPAASSARESSDMPVAAPDGTAPESLGAAGFEAPIDVVVEPGQAFGTGGHATTRICLELLLDLADEGENAGPLADLGTGSGVLAIAAAKLGWAPVLGCDSEPAALEAAMANAGVNGVELELRRINLREDSPPVAPTVVANLTAPLLREVAARLVERPRAMICSGLLAAESGQVADAFAAAGMVVRERRQRGDWVGLCLARRGT